MGGIGVLFFILLYLAITVLVLIKVKPWQGKVMMLLIAILLPTADAVYGRYKLKQMCDEDGSTKIYRTVNGVLGFLYTKSPADKYSVEKGTYQFSEGQNARGIYYRFTLEDGKLISEKGVVPISKYQVKFLGPDRKNNYWKYKYIVETFPDGEVLASQTNISFRGGWVEQFLGSFTGAGAGTVDSCLQRMDKDSLISSVLKP